MYLAFSIWWYLEVNIFVFTKYINWNLIYDCSVEMLSLLHEIHLTASQRDKKKERETVEGGCEG